MTLDEHEDLELEITRLKWQAITTLVASLTRGGLLRGVGRVIGVGRRQARRAEGRGLGRLGCCADGQCAAPPAGYELVPK
jgi:hypothetical protein